MEHYLILNICFYTEFSLGSARPVVDVKRIGRKDKPLSYIVPGHDDHD